MGNKATSLVFATVLTSSSSLSVILTIRLFADIVNGTRSQRLYTFIVQLICPTISLITSLLAFMIIFYTVKRYIILSALLLSIMSIFGALMTCAITIFDTGWRDDFTVLQHIILLAVNALLFTSSVYVTVVATRQFQHLARFPQTFSPLREVDLSKAVSVLSSILIISGGAGILGFSMGTTTLSGRQGSQLYWGGLHSGCLSITSGILSVICMYFCRHFRYQGVLITTTGVNVVTFLASGFSFYTEELELSHHLGTFSPAEREVSTAVYNLILGKSCLVLISAVANLVLIPSLQACLLRHLYDSLADREGDCTLRGECFVDTGSAATNDLIQPGTTSNMVVPSNLHTSSPSPVAMGGGTAGNKLLTNMMPYQHYIYPDRQPTKCPMYNIAPYVCETETHQNY